MDLWRVLRVGLVSEVMNIIYTDSALGQYERILTNLPSFGGDLLEKTRVELG